MLLQVFGTAGREARRFRFHHGRDAALKRASGLITVPRDER
jgi:hypothetical protein